MVLAFAISVGCGGVDVPSPRGAEHGDADAPDAAAQLDPDSASPPFFPEPAPGGVTGDAEAVVVNTEQGAKLLAPVAPVTGDFMWPSLQTKLRKVPSGASCAGRVTLAVSDHAVCFSATDDTMKCAGNTYTTEYGWHFTDAGQQGVDQIILSSTQGDATANNVCVHRVDKKVLCFGGYNATDVFTTGNTDPVVSWTPWGGGKDFERIAGDAVSVLCALDGTGGITCNPPYMAGPGAPFDRITFGPNGIGGDATILRSASCDVTTAGVRCHAPIDPAAVPVQPSSGIVDAGFFLAGPGGPYRECVLDEKGLVTCGGLENGTMKYWRAFARAGGLVAFSMAPHSHAMCAVSETGALWCVGSNAKGELGTGTKNAVPVGIEVLPPGSVHIGCP